MAQPVFILNGPNLNMLGTREPEIYGAETLAEIAQSCGRRAGELGLSVDFRQTNQEGELVEWVQSARNEASGIIINAAAYTHTSVALLDALKATDMPVIEVHLSNVYQREDFRHQSYVSPAAKGVICGFGGQGYLFALEAMSSMLTSNEK